MKHIVFSINDGYTKQLCVTIASIMHQNKNVHFHVINSDLTQQSKHTLLQMVRGRDDIQLDFISLESGIFNKLKLNIDYISVETYFRYVIADLLSNIDKCLYLDADLVVNGNLDEFYNTNLGDNYCAGVEDLYIEYLDYKKKIGFQPDDLYINAGVLLLNLSKMRKDNVSDVLIKNTIKLADKIEFQDQDIINITFKNHIVSCDSIYNFTSQNVIDEPHKRRKARIIHYTGKRKPWHPNCPNKMYTIWNKYEKKATKIMKKKIKVALLIDEFFGGAGTAFGGYGALARKYIAKYIPCENISMDVLLGSGGHRFTTRKYHVDDVDLYKLPRKHWATRLFLKRKNYDIYLSIELTNDWVLKHETNKNKKLILWIQDPRPKYEWEEIATMKLMPEPNYYNQKIYDLVHDLYKQNRVSFVSQAYFLNQKAKDLYRLDDDTKITYMPNPIYIDENFDVKTYKKQNKIIFLGRLEDVKRGWLFCEIAKRVPEYEFFVLGKINSTKKQTAAFWDQYKNIPNLHFAGHVDGEVKEQFLKDSKILINTSIHEGLPVSFLEALSYGCCLVSNRNPDSLTEKFGIWVGDVLGDGFDKIDLYVDAVRELMTNDKKREKLAIAGREYVQKIHNIPRFVNDLRSVIYEGK